MTDTDGSNVLFVVLDTVRKDHLSVYDSDRDTTPHLAEFAEEAAVFEQAVAPAPWTLPVHASMFTGLYPSEHGATQEDPYLEGATTLAESLSAAGYDTACYSSNAWITSYTNLTAGFDDHDNFFQIMPSELLSGPLATLWKTMNDSDTLRGVADRLVQVGNKLHEHLAEEGGGDTKTPQVIDRTIDFVDESDDFFAFINLMDAHLPYHPPEEYAERFAPGVDSTGVCQNSKEFNCGARGIGDEEWDAIRGLYDAELAHIDDQLHRLFAHLKETGQWEDTTVVVCADHGELHGEHDLYGHEFGIYDPLVNVPLMVKHPDVKPGRDEETTVELVDLYHTILDATGTTGRGKALDDARSLLSADYRDFADDVGGTDRTDVGFVEYHQPVVELRQLEGKASGGHRVRRAVTFLLADGGRSHARREVHPLHAHPRRGLRRGHRPRRDREPRGDRRRADPPARRAVRVRRGGRRDVARRGRRRRRRRVRRDGPGHERPPAGPGLHRLA